MEHLPSPAEPAYRAFKIPCLNREPYDGGEFFSYATRCGWDASRLLTGDFTEHDSRRTAAFLQDWLYFGTLVELLGEEASKTAFTKSDSVTTIRLEELIQKRVQLISKLHFVHDEQAEQLVRRAEACLAHVSYFCCFASADATATIYWPLPVEIDLSIRVLGQRLTGAYIAGLGNLSGLDATGKGVFLMDESVLWQLKWSPPFLVTQRLREQKWCPSDVARATEQFSPSSMYYISQLKHTATSRDHDKCSDRKCIAFQVNEDTYQTKHVSESCTCNFLGPDMSSIVRIIEAGKIPLLTLDADESNIRIIVDAHVPEKSYRPQENYNLGPVRLVGNIKDFVAISHVWADGLGNAKYNALPYCQLRRLKSVLDELRDQKSSINLLNMGKLGTLVRKKRNLSLRFWMDTLCIPVDPTLKHVRKKAIQNMRDVYDKSNQVIVLDADLQNVSSKSTDLTEIFMRISLSGWMRRLWTLQEGVLGGRLHFKFNDQILDIHKMYDDINEVDRSLVKKMTETQRLARTLANVKGTPRSDSTQFFWRMRSMRASLFPEDEGKAIGYRTSSFSDPETQKSINETRRLAGIMSAFEAARFRTTSRVEDVYLCMGSLLGWAGSDLNSIPIEQRLRTMLEQQTSLPQGIIFVPGSRNKDMGWRWAVTNFDDEEQTIMKANIDDADPGIRDSDGLTVKYRGLVLPKEASDALFDSDVVVADTFTGHRRWWHISLLETLNPDEDGILCILFYVHSPKHIPQRSIQMAAAAINVDPSASTTIYDAGKRVCGRFEALATVELVGSTEEMELRIRRPDVRVKRIEQLIGMMERPWTIQ